MKSKKFSCSIVHVYVLIFLMINCSLMMAQEQSTHPQDSPFHTSHAHTPAPLESVPSFDIDYLKTIQGVKHAIPLSDYFFENVDCIPAFADTLFTAFNESKRNIPELFHYAFSLLSSKAGGYGPPVQGSWMGNTIRSEDDITTFFKRDDIELINAKEWIKLPFQFRKEVLEFLSSIERAGKVTKSFTNPVIAHLQISPDRKIDETYELLMTPWKSRELISWETVDVIKRIDEKILSYATRIACEKLNRFVYHTPQSFPDDFTGCSIYSSLGELLINGTGNDTINGDKFCVIELGGEDVYMGNTASPPSLLQPLGIIIDFSGDDKYLCEDNFLISGILGLAFLLDLDGDDYYHTTRPGLSSSLYGTSMLYDQSGDDIYISEDLYSQGASYVGISLFIDLSGNDQYSSSSYSLGFGGTKGAAIFFDGGGNDSYDAPQDMIHNRSFVHGAAKGRWAEATDGQSLAGGIGIFFDNSGTDTYQVESFSLGAAYYFGLGIFSDGEGNDKYNAISHSQGYAAHYALSAFIEKDGNDNYNSESNAEKQTQLIGCGRDHSAGIFIDYKGSDKYQFGNRSVGIGDLYAIGLFADYEGEDTYQWNKNKMNSGSPSLGASINKASGMRFTFKVIPDENSATGIFYDSNGDGL